MYYYYLPEPPYFLLIFGLLAGVTCGLAFEATLKQNLKQWTKKPTNQAIEQVQGFNLQFPFLGICLGICVFLSAGLEIFIFDRWLAYAISLPLTIFIAGLVWKQLGILLQQLQRGGSKAIDLDSFE
jgi:hypothetical protein